MCIGSHLTTKLWYHPNLIFNREFILLYKIKCKILSVSFQCFNLKSKQWKWMQYTSSTYLTFVKTQSRKAGTLWDVCWGMAGAIFHRLKEKKIFWLYITHGWHFMHFRQVSIKIKTCWHSSFRTWHSFIVQSKIHISC